MTSLITIEELNTILTSQCKDVTNKIAKIQMMGEIVNVSKPFKNDSGISFTLRDNGAQFSCKAWSRNIDIQLIKDCENKYCTIVGYVKHNYFNGHQFVLELCEDVIFENDDSELKKLKAECDALGYFLNKKVVQWNTIKRIGLISKKDTQGYNDFMTQFCIPLQIALKEIALEGCSTETELIQAIQEFQDAQEQIDIIFIIRGGGSTIDISNSYDKLSIFEAIRNSRIPVVTAIGHEADKGDKLLITNVSDRNFDTPSTLALELNKIYIRPVLLRIEKQLDKIKNQFEYNIEESRTEAFNKLSAYFREIFRELFGGIIISVGNDDNMIIVEKNAQYFRVNMDFSQRMEICDDDINTKLYIEEGLQYCDVNIIKTHFDVLLKSHKDKILFSTEVKKLVKQLQTLEKEQEDFFQPTKTQISFKEEYKEDLRTEKMTNKQLKKLYNVFLKYHEILENLDDNVKNVLELFT